MKPETIKFTTKSGRVIDLGVSANGIYCGDYLAHVSFQKIIDLYIKNLGVTTYKHRDVEAVMKLALNASNDGEIYCTCPVAHISRRVKQLEKLGYKVIKDNFGIYDRVEEYHKECHFVVVAK